MTETFERHKTFIQDNIPIAWLRVSLKRTGMILRSLQAHFFNNGRTQEVDASEEYWKCARWSIQSFYFRLIAYSFGHHLWFSFFACLGNSLSFGLCNPSLRAQGGRQSLVADPTSRRTHGAESRPPLILEYLSILDLGLVHTVHGNVRKRVVIFSLCDCIHLVRAKAPAHLLQDSWHYSPCEATLWWQDTKARVEWIVISSFF